MYIQSYDGFARFVLGEEGENNLIVFGVNPSVATNLKDDLTIKAVRSFAKQHGFDGWIMLNLYPQRATNPSELEKAPRLYLHKENMGHIQKILSHYRGTIVVAWGSLIEKRSYLKQFMLEIYLMLRTYDSRKKKLEPDWFSLGSTTKNGHPHHPLRLGKDSPLQIFDIESYIQNHVPWHEFYKQLFLLKRISRQYIHACASFQVYETLNQLRSNGDVGKDEAKKNLKIMNRCKYFFQKSEDACWRQALLLFAQIFDKGSDVVDLRKLNNRIAKYLKEGTISKSYFKSINKGRIFIDELAKSYDPLSKEVDSEVRVILSKYDDLIDSLRVYRNDHLGHFYEIPRGEEPLTVGELNDFIADIGNVLNKMTDALDNLITTYDVVRRDADQDTKDLFYICKVVASG